LFRGGTDAHARRIGAWPARPVPSERERAGFRTEIRTALNLAYVAVILLANVVLFLALPLWLPPKTGWWALLALPLALTAVTHWGLIHEAVHGVLHPDRRVNRLLGHVLSIAFLCPYNILRFGHLCHHALNGRPSDRPELYDPARRRPGLCRAWYYYRLFFGLYGGELFCVLLCYVPRQRLRRITRHLAYGDNPDSLQMPDIAERQLTDPRPLLLLRLEATAILLLLGGGLALYGAWFPLLLAALVVRGTLISFLDNAPHYSMPLGDIRQGHDLRLSPVLRWLVMNGNFHGTHHRHPTLPWTLWPTRFRDDGASFAGGYFRHPLRQLRGPIALQQLESAVGTPVSAATGA